MFRVSQGDRGPREPQDDARPLLADEAPARELRRPARGSVLGIQIATRFDLQSHSTYSDGVLSPAGVVASGAAAGIELLALTDHDTVAGVDEAVAAGEEHGVAVIPAVEVSATDLDH